MQLLGALRGRWRFWNREHCYIIELVMPSSRNFNNAAQDYACPTKNVTSGSTLMVPHRTFLSGITTAYDSEDDLNSSDDVRAERSEERCIC